MSVFGNPAFLLLSVWSQRPLLCTSQGFQCLGCGGNGLYSLSCGGPVTSWEELGVIGNSLSALYMLV
jgi:hypothetical protein